MSLKRAATTGWSIWFTHHRARSNGANTKMPVLGAPQCGSSDQPLRGDQEGQRTHGAYVQHLYQLPTTGLRFFTVYVLGGGRTWRTFPSPSIQSGQPIDLFNEGRMKRDFTYIDDIVEGIRAGSERTATTRSPGTARIPTRPRARRRTDFTTSGTTIQVEASPFRRGAGACLGREARKNASCRCNRADVPATCADVSELTRDVGSSRQRQSKTVSPLCGM